MGPAQTKLSAVSDLFEAHRELATVELLELKGALVRGAVWMLLAALGSLGAWLSLNGAVLALCWQRPWAAAAGVIAANVVLTLIGVLGLLRVARAPYFQCVKREVGRDLAALVRTLR